MIAQFRCLRLLLAILPLVLVACSSTRSSHDRVDVEPEVVRSVERFRKEYVLAPGDQVEIVVRRTPEVSRTVTVRPDGFITIPLVDDVRAGGLTPRELDQNLTRLLSERLVDPDVTVIASQVRQPIVYVTGEVNNGGAVVPLRDAPTAMQAITFAGGLRRSAAAGDVAVIRLNDEGFLELITVPPLASGQPGRSMALMALVLQPDDVIFVPESGRSQFARVLDDFVNRPLAGLNALVGTYVNFELVEELTQ